MVEIIQQPPDAAQLDLEKYGLSYLTNKYVQAWTDSDIDQLMEALDNENIAPRIPILFTPPNIKRLLSTSYCRRCGNCCLSNPLYASQPGVLVFEKELKCITKHSNYSYKFLKRKSVKYNNPERNDVRHLPLPCLFYQQGKCTIYDVRPFVCKIYPVKDSTPINGKVYITISLRCDYGKDLYRYALNELKKRKKPTLVA